MSVADTGQFVSSLDMNKLYRNLHTSSSRNNPVRVVRYEDGVSNELDRARYAACLPVKAFINAQRGKGFRFDIYPFFSLPRHSVTRRQDESASAV